MGLLSTGRIDCDSLAGMSKTVRSWDVDKAWLLPPSIHDLVPAGVLRLKGYCRSLEYPFPHP